MQKKFQVFISSTYRDLAEERQIILKAVLDLSHIPSGMEGFYAADEEQLSYIKRIIDECDYYVLILAGRYGSVDADGISYTEREYDYALSKGVYILAFIHNDVGSIAQSKVDDDPEKVRKLETFKDRVAKNRLVSYWRTMDGLHASVLISLSKSFGSSPAIGWVRGDTVANEDVLTQLNVLRNRVDHLEGENTELRTQLQPNVTNLAPLEAGFQVRFSYYDSRDVKIFPTISITWSQIVKIVCPSLFGPQIPTEIESCLKSYISELYQGVYLRHLNISDADLNTIKLQLFAYGFVKSYNAASKDGGVREYIQITDLGKLVLLETSTVRLLSE